MTCPQPSSTEALPSASENALTLTANFVSVQFLSKIKLESPSPDRYDLKLGFDHISRRNRMKTFCFATGRDAYEKVFMPAKANVPDAIVPGPGTYNF